MYKYHIYVNIWENTHTYIHTYIFGKSIYLKIVYYILYIGRLKGETTKAIRQDILVRFHNINTNKKEILTNFLQCHFSYIPRRKHELFYQL